MIVPADRVFYSPERFYPCNPLKPGAPFEIDSGMGGSYTVVYRGKPENLAEGRLVFEYDHGDYKGRKWTCSCVEAPTILFSLQPSWPFHYDRPLPKYGIRVVRRGEDTVSRAVGDTLGRARSEGQHCILLTGYFGNSPSPYWPGADIGPRMLLRWPNPADETAWRKEVNDEMRRRIVKKYGAQSAYVLVAVEALSEQEIARRQECLRLCGAPELDVFDPPKAGKVHQCHEKSGTEVVPIQEAANEHASISV